MGFSSPLSLSDSEKSTVLEVVLDDDVSDGVEDKLDVVGVSGAREMCVYLLGVFALVKVLELLLDIRRRLLVRVATCRTQHYSTALYSIIPFPDYFLPKGQIPLVPRNFLLTSLTSS